MENRELENKISSVICDIVPEDSFSKISEKIAAGETALMIFPGKVPEEFMQLPGKKLRLNLWLNRRYPLYVCNFLTADIPCFEGVKYFRIGEKNE